MFSLQYSSANNNDTHTHTQNLESAPSEAQSGACEIRLKVYDRVLATVSALGLIFGGAWSLFEYASSRTHENELRTRELNLAIFRERRDTYFAISDAASDIAASRSREDVIERSRAFLKLYNGRAHLLAEIDSDVKSSKIEFKNLLFEYLDGKDKNTTESPFDYFGAAAYQLTKACSRHLDPRGLDPIEAKNWK
ncbi:MAG: hypothetical protein WCJ09_10855 [Planctomycetota bacterium]